MILDFNSRGKRYKEFYAELEKFEYEIDCQFRSRVKDYERKRIRLDVMKNILEGYEDIKALFRVFPDLCNSFLKNYDSDLLMYIAFIKVTLMKEDMSILSDEELRNFMEAIYKIYKLDISGLTDPANIYEVYLSDYERYAMIHYDHIITSYSKESIVFFINTTFDKPFGVKCKHCGDESNPLWLKEGEVKELEDMPISIANERVRWRMDMLIQNGFQMQIRELWELYGGFKCKKCGKENIPIEAAGLYLKGDTKWRLKVDEYLVVRMRKLLLESIDKNDPEWYHKQVFYTNYITGMYREIYGEGNLKCYQMLLETARSVYSNYGSDYVNYIVNDAVTIMKKYNDVDVQYADTYVDIANTLSMSNKDDDKVRAEIQKYYKCGAEIYKGLLGENSDKYRETINIMNRSAGDQSQPTKRLDLKAIAAKKIRNTINNITNINNNTQSGINTVNTNTNPDRGTTQLNRSDNMTNRSATSNTIAMSINNKSEDELNKEKYEKEHSDAKKYAEENNYKEAAIHQEIYVGYCEREYGVESDLVANYRQELANMYMKEGRFNKAKANLDKALKIHIEYLNKECSLPVEIAYEFHNMLFINDINNERCAEIIAKYCLCKDWIRVKSVSNALSEFGELYLVQKDYVKALRFNKLGYELWLRRSKSKMTIELGNKNLAIAKIFHAVKDVKNESIELKKTIEVFEYCISHSEFKSEIEEAKKALKEAMELTK